MPSLSIVLLLAELEAKAKVRLSDIRTAQGSLDSFKTAAKWFLEEQAEAEELTVLTIQETAQVMGFIALVQQVWIIERGDRGGCQCTPLLLGGLHK